MRALVTCAALASVLALVACGEKVQTASHKKSDNPASKGANPAYTAGSWKAGDAAAWEAQIKTRAQGQNEYSRSAP